MSWAASVRWILLPPLSSVQSRPIDLSVRRCEIRLPAPDVAWLRLSVALAFAEKVGKGARSAVKISELAAAKSCWDILDAAFNLAASRVCAKVRGPESTEGVGARVCAAKEKLVRQAAKKINCRMLIPTLSAKRPDHYLTKLEIEALKLVQIDL